jgi:hypothetical protein
MEFYKNNQVLFSPKLIYVAEKSLFYCCNSNFLDDILKKVPELSEPYIPTRFWGFSGHIQTIVQVQLFAAIIIV